MKRNLEIEITSLYGSAEFPRKIMVDKPKMSRTKKRVTKRSDIDISVETSTSEQKSEQAEESVNSFNYIDGQPVVRLGGAYGKFVGLLRQAGVVLATTNEEGFTKAGTERMIPTIQVIPEFTKLELNGSKIQTIKGLVSVNSMFGGKSTQKPTMWDIIPSCKTKLTLIYPDAFDKNIVSMLKMAENLNFAERRRARVKILKGL